MVHEIMSFTLRTYFLQKDEEGGMSLKPLALKTFNDCLKILFKDGVDRHEEFSLYYKVQTWTN